MHLWANELSDFNNKDDYTSIIDVAVNVCKIVLIIITSSRLRPNIHRSEGSIRITISLVISHCR